MYVDLNIIHKDIIHKEQYVPVGQSVTIKCYKSDSSKPVLWDYRHCVEHSVHSCVKHNVQHIYHEHLLGVYEQKCTIDYSTYDLTILEVELDDAGEYWCHESEGFGTRHITQLYVTGMVHLVVLDFEIFCSCFFDTCFDNLDVTMSMWHVWLYFCVSKDQLMVYSVDDLSIQESCAAARKPCNAATRTCILGSVERQQGTK